MPATAAAVDSQIESAAADDVRIHVSPNGNDQNPGTPDQPLRTFEEAVRRLQPLWSKQQRIKLEPGTYTLPALPSIFSVSLGQAVGAEGEPLVIEGAFADQIGNRQVTTAAGASLTFAGNPVRPDTLMGSRLRFTSGPAAGQVHVVTGNSANTLTVKSAFSPVPAAGNSFVIERPAVEIVYPQGMTFYGGGASLLVLVGLRFRPQKPSVGNFFQFSGGLQIYAEGCEWNMNGGIFQVVEQSTLNAGGVGGLIALGLLSSLDNEILDLGCYACNGLKASPQVDGAAGFRASNGFISGSWVFQKIGVNVQGGGLTLFNPVAKACSFTCDGFYGTAHLELRGPGRIENAPEDAAGKVDAVKVSHGGHLRIVDMEINGAVNAIFADEESLVFLERVTGTGKARFGVTADNGTRVRADADTNVTGKSGDILLSRHRHSWSEAQVPAGITDAATFTRIEKLP